MGIQFDTRVGHERAQFATQMKTMPEWIRPLLDAGFTLDETPDFFEGLLAGYATSFALLEELQADQAKLIIGAAVAKISSLTI